MARCSEQPSMYCIGPGGSCDGLRQCAHAKKDREDWERDHGASTASNDDIGVYLFWIFILICVISYFS